ncbi:hypothetical protein GALL_494710 [mine drainage metagenome]|uniref:Uncharacterized protein n=1 Tax=mine drainage metagenome TaxID=410659 RepID=A0A1J5PUG8_9ZZZZ
MREVHNPHHAEDERQAEREQDVDGAYLQARQDELYRGLHSEWSRPDEPLDQSPEASMRDFSTSFPSVISVIITGSCICCFAP